MLTTPSSLSKTVICSPRVGSDSIISDTSFNFGISESLLSPNFSKKSFVHTRLTHSLEVSVVGRSLGRKVGKILIEKHPHLKKSYGFQSTDFGAIVAAASLAHDIGNPPFGHSGEMAIGDYFKNGEGSILNHN